MGLVSSRGLTRWRAWPVAGALLLAFGSCRAIAGLHDVTYVASDGACATPALPTAGNDRVRLVNAGTQGSPSDFCIRASGTSDWGTSVFATGGPSCQFGLGYAQATVPFAAPAATIDVKAIPAQSSCDAAATSELDGVVLAAPDAAAPLVTTLVRYGGGSNAEHISALVEDPPGSRQSERLRVVNALSSGQPINFGPSAASSLPTTVTASFPVPIPPGGVEPPATSAPGLGAVDDAGYLVTVSTEVHFGADFQGNPNALFTIATPAGGDVQSLYAMGDSTDAQHAIRGLLCEDAPPTGGGDAGTGSILASCVLSALPDLIVDTFNIGLYGAFAPFNDERRAAVTQAVAAASADLMCVVEADLDSDKEAIADAAQSNFPYTYFVKTDLDTLPTDPTDANGQTPPLPTAPPCAGIDPTILASIFQCSAQSCATPPDMSGHIETTNCLSTACLGQYVALYQQGAAQNACFDCIIYYETGEAPLSVARSECTTDSRRPFVYEGMNGSEILSRHPLRNTSAYILAGTGFRRTLLYAQVDLGDQTVDFYCGSVITPDIDTDLPYTGNYGHDGTLPDGGTENGWEDEQNLQIGKLIPWIEKTSGASGDRAIIAGDWYSDVGVTDASGQVVLAALAPEVIGKLDRAYGGAFDRAEPPGYVPSCDQCPAPENVLDGNAPPEDVTPTFLLGFSAGSTLDDEFLDQANTVPLTSIPYETAPDGGYGPVSGDYLRSVRLLRPPGTK